MTGACREAWSPLPYATPMDLWNAFKAGRQFVLHYHGHTYPVTHMDPREHVVYVQPPGMPVKVRPDGSSAEGPGKGIWLAEAEVAAAPAPQLGEGDQDTLNAQIGALMNEAPEITWFIMNGDESAYCMEFSRPDRHNPEADAKEWLADMTNRHPEHVASNGYHAARREIWPDYLGETAAAARWVHHSLRILPATTITGSAEGFTITTGSRSFTAASLPLVLANAVLDAAVA